jgi:hypothetical protein
MNDPAGIFHTDGQRPAALLADKVNRHIVGVILDIELLLPTIDVQVLTEIAFLIEKTNPN